MHAIARRWKPRSVRRVAVPRQIAALLAQYDVPPALRAFVDRHAYAVAISWDCHSYSSISEVGRSSPFSEDLLHVGLLRAGYLPVGQRRRHCILAVVTHTILATPFTVLLPGMIVVFLFALTLTLAPTAQTSRTEVSANGAVDYDSADFSGSGVTAPHATTTGGGAAGNVRLFFDAVIDDDAAPSLQAYLQRVGQFSFFGGGYGWSTDYGAGFKSNTTTNGYAGIDLDGYFGPHRAIYGDIGTEVQYSATHVGWNNQDTSTLAIPTWISLGARWRDLRVRASWQVTPTRIGQGDFTVPFWGNAGLHAYGVVKRRLELDIEVFALDGGASADGGATLWLARRFGIDAGVNGGHEIPSTTHRTEDFAGAIAGFTCWLTARFALHASYQPEWRQYTGNGAPTTSEIEHRVTFGFTGRP